MERRTRLVPNWQGIGTWCLILAAVALAVAAAYVPAMVARAAVGCGA
jgi:hypothetical protein